MYQCIDPAHPRENTGTILVVGSINMDHVVRCSHLPAPGQTVLGSDLSLHPGGKGANSATAAAKLVERTRDQRVGMIGAVGRDAHGTALRRNLAEWHIDITAVISIEDAPTGAALIAVADGGENSIIVLSGANWRLHPAAVEQAMHDIRPRIVLVQLEIPTATITHAAALACTRLGAQSAQPTRAEILRLLPDLKAG